ncbi:porin [Seohaeicola nanhaiensis]|uniref:Porin n=1 Tax=Seohaeicola nanhaiensis TaxID=1387282 RepID=A0ABV9KHE9_9RHOB
MKKVLFATTALIATASMAAAEVKISGYGRFGLDYNDRNAVSGTNGIGAPANGISETTITSRLRLQFDMSTETDGGVTLGARFRAQAESRDNVAGTAGFNGARFYASYGGFTLGVGNIIGAIEGMPGLYLETNSAGIGIDGAGFHSLVTNVNNSFFDWDAYDSVGAGANGIEVLYKSGAFAAHISYSETNARAATFRFDPTTGLAVPVPATPRTNRTAANVAYTFGDWTAALAVQSSDRIGEDKTVFTIAGNIGQFGVRFAAADNDGIKKYGIYGNMDIGTASNILLFVTSEDAADAGAIAQGRDNRDSTAGNDTGGEGESYGIHYAYDLGGGASFEAGAVRSSNDQTQVQAGVFFKF